MRDPWPKGFDSETIATIQTIQDSLASLSGLYIAALDAAGNPLTIPSNQAARCTECRTRYSEVPCLPNVKQAIADTADKRITTVAHCPFGLITHFSPLGTLGSPAHSGMGAILSIGKLEVADRSAHPDRLPKDVEKTVATFCKVFDLIFSLAQHAGSPGASAKAAATPGAQTAPLSSREREVLHQVALGLSNRGIAERLFISETTVKTHVHNISRKVKINNRTSLALFFLQST